MPQQIPFQSTPDQKETIREAMRTILMAVGEDPDRDGLLGTPDRIARMYDDYQRLTTELLERGSAVTAS